MSTAEAAGPRKIEPPKLADYTVQEEAFVLHSGTHSIVFGATEKIRESLDALRSGPLGQTGKPPLTYVLVALAIDGGESISEVWVDGYSGDSCDAVIEAIEVLGPVRERLSTIDRANHRVAALHVADEAPV